MTLIEGTDRITRERLLYEWDGERLSRVQDGRPDYVVGKISHRETLDRWMFYRGLDIICIVEEP